MAVSPEQFKLVIPPELHEHPQGVLFSGPAVTASLVELEHIEHDPSAPSNLRELEVIPEKQEKPQGRIFDEYKIGRLHYAPVSPDYAFTPKDLNKELEDAEPPIRLRPPRGKKKPKVQKAEAVGLEKAVWSWPLEFDSLETAQTMNQALNYLKRIDKSQRNLWAKKSEIHGHQESDRFGRPDYPKIPEYLKASDSRDQSAGSKERLTALLTIEIGKLKGIETEDNGSSKNDLEVWSKNRRKQGYLDSAVDIILSEYSGLAKEDREAIKNKVEAEVVRLNSPQYSFAV